MGRIEILNIYFYLSTYLMYFLVTTILPSCFIIWTLGLFLSSSRIFTTTLLSVSFVILIFTPDKSEFKSLFCETISKIIFSPLGTNSTALLNSLGYVPVLVLFYKSWSEIFL